MKMKYLPWKRAAAALVAVFLAVGARAQYAGTYSELEDSETVRALKGHVSRLAAPALRGRKAGSEGERAAARYVYARLKACGVEMLCPEDGDSFGISREEGDTLRSANVYGFIQGADKALNDRYVVVGARMDNLGVNRLTVDGRPAEQIYYGANGNASGVALLLELARLVNTNAPLFRRSVLFIGFGASCQGFAGSWYFLNRSFGDAGRIDAMINLDMVGAGGDGFCAYTASNPDLNALLDRVAGRLNPLVPKVTAAEPYPSDHRSFYAAGIPSVCFSTGKYPEYATERDRPDILRYEDMEAELEYLYNFTREIAGVPHAPAFGTEKETEERADDRIYDFYECEVRPSFLGHYDPKWFLANWVYPYLKYPEEAVRKGVQGRVTVRFEIDRKGRVGKVQVRKGADPLLDAEAVKVIAASPDWKPGRAGGRKVTASLDLTVEFRLERKGGRRNWKLKR